MKTVQDAETAVIFGVKGSNVPYVNIVVSLCRMRNAESN